MQFLNIAMLFGLLAVAIPVVLHLLNRRSPKRIDWGAMMFLLESMRRSQRRVLLEDVLLLGCRSLIVTLVALVFARPFIPQDSPVPWVVVMPLLIVSVTLFGISFALWRYPKWRLRCMLGALAVIALVMTSVLFERNLNLRRFGRGAQKDIVVVVDGSSSMSIDVDGQSNFDRACGDAAKYIGEAPRGTAFSIIVGGAVPRVLNPTPISERRILLETLEEIKPSAGTMHVPATLTAAAMTLAAGNNGVKQILIIGDGQAAGWAPNDTGRWKNIERLFGQLPSPPQVVWRTLPLPASVRNLAVADVTLSRDVVGADREAGIRVTVRNSGTEAVTPEEIVVEVDGARLSNRTAGQLVPGASQAFVFRHRFKEPGATLVTARVVAGDDLPADDQFEYVVPVLDKLKVLIVDGGTGSRPFAKSSMFLSLALRPDIPLAGTSAATSVDNTQRDFLLEAVVEPLHRTSLRDDFGDFAVVILADVPKLPDKVLAALASHCARGGGLFIPAGPKARPDVFNNWAYEGEPILPLALGSWQSPDPATGTGAGSRIDTGSFAHDIMRNLRDGTDLGMTAPLQYWKLDEGTDRSGNVAGRLVNGDPFFAVKPLGRGTVAMAAFPNDAIVSDLPSRIGFVPLVHEIAYYLAKPVAAQLNIKPSEGATLLLKPHISPIVDDGAETALGRAVQITDPNGEMFAGELFEAELGTSLRISRGLEPGVYDVALTNGLAEAAGMKNVIFSVARGIEESALDAMTDAQKEAVMQCIQLLQAAEHGDVLSALRGETFGKEIWRILAFGVLLFLVLEVWLTRWISIRRRTGEAENVAFTNEGPGGADSFRESLAKIKETLWRT